MSQVMYKEKRNRMMHSSPCGSPLPLAEGALANAAAPGKWLYLLGITPVDPLVQVRIGIKTCRDHLCEHAG
ncbi:hypothetical protein KSX_80840 [Ktedonospora formicarum]|uniref:Uncharacterized protein n=1 Tax=Ktedonospora formicarum TaxID=2778364 RepID=A0A8J3I9I9_9CHLR|nr:hypothetical protein KSX_80840 [Ktedonospora formicarum]